MQLIKCTESEAILTCELRKQQTLPFVNHDTTVPITSTDAGTAGIAAAEE